MSCINDLLGYMNYEGRPAGDGAPTIMVHDHRAVLPAIWAARKDGLFQEPPLLLRLDAHDDFAEKSIDYGTAAKEIKSLEDCLVFANGLRNDDGGWVQAVVNLGWVRDVVTFYVQDRTLTNRHITVRDHNNVEHNIFSLERFADLLGSRGSLGDAVRKAENLALHQALGWDVHKGWASLHDTHPCIWFDVDLDFAVHYLGDFGRMPWRWKDFRQQFCRPFRNSQAPYYNLTPAGVLAQAIGCAQLVTIATEPDFSCGYAGVARILASLDRCFRDYGDWFSEWNE